VKQCLVLHPTFRGKERGQKGWSRSSGRQWVDFLGKGVTSCCQSGFSVKSPDMALKTMSFKVFVVEKEICMSYLQNMYKDYTIIDIKIVEIQLN